MYSNLDFSIHLIACCILQGYALADIHSKKSSVNSFALNKKTTFTVKHNTTGVTYIGKNSPSKYTLNIYLQKKSGLQYSDTGDSF